MSALGVCGRRGLEELERRERSEEGWVRRPGAGIKSIREMVGAIFPTSELVMVRLCSG